MRTTISIEDGLLERARIASKSTGKSLGQIVEDALRLALATRPRSSEAHANKPIKTFGGTGTMPGVDLKSASALSEIMEHS
jgi:hypothetical protein